jgi:hypothetical protein
MDLAVVDIVSLAVIGVVAGLLGGLLGIGGSVVMLPALAMLFAGRDWASQHLYQAAAMVVNTMIALPAARQHYRKGAFRKALFVVVMPATLVAIIVGVLVSDQLPGYRLQQVLAGFLGYVTFTMVYKAVRGQPEFTPEQERATTPRLAAVGGVMGFAAGLLGIGGAVVATPLMQALSRIPIKNAIAVSAMTMCVTSPIGAALKVARIGEHGHAIMEPLVMAALLTPAAILGSFIGAKITHKLPVKGLRMVFAVVLAIVAVRLWVAGSSAAHDVEAPPHAAEQTATAEQAPTDDDAARTPE